MGLIKLQHLSVKNRLYDVSFEVQQGEVMGLIGPNGSGKSTLLNAIAGLLDKSGRIDMRGKDLDGCSPIQKARCIALQPQFVQPAWALSVHDVVSLGRLPWGDSDQDVIHQAMQQANVLELANRHVDELSGGEIARVWLARVLANQADILLVDEPVASLDIHYQQEVMQVLTRYAKSGHAVIIAIHDLSLAAQFCDRLCLLNDGKLVRAGTISEVFITEILEKVFKVKTHIDLVSRPPVILARD